MVEPWLNTFDVIKKTYTDPSLLAPRLASVKSAFLVVKVDQGIEGNLRIDFDREVDYTTPVARTLILDLLEDFGAELPEMKTWTSELRQEDGRRDERPPVGGRRCARSSAWPTCPASRPAVPATTAAHRRQGRDEGGEPSRRSPTSRTQPDNVGTSQAYFRSVAAMIEGLKKTDRPTYRSTKLWYDRYAKQIEELPILGVDKELLDWGAHGRPHDARDVLGDQLLLAEPEIRGGVDPLRQLRRLRRLLREQPGLRRSPSSRSRRTP